MPLLGQGVLAIWNGMAPGWEDAFVAWHVREHMPERVGLPGFLRGRRYVAIEGSPKYFNFYETSGPQALTSATYLERLNHPTPWTRDVVAQFRDTSRTVCDVVASHGHGEGGAIETVRLRPDSPADAFAARIDAALRELLTAPGIVGAHLLQGRPNDSAAASATSEKALSGRPDEVVDWIVLIEAVGAETLRAARDLIPLPGAVRGIYQLEFGLTA